MRTNLEVFIKLIEDKAHAVHETVHVRRCTLVVCRALVRCQCFLECLEISHPLEGKSMRLDIDLVKDDDKRKLGLVEDTEKADMSQAFEQDKTMKAKGCPR